MTVLRKPSGRLWLAAVALAAAALIAPFVPGASTT
jgi:hypothetical protein